MLRTSLIAGRHVQWICDPPDSRIYCLSLSTAHLLVRAADVVIEKRGEIQPVTARLRRHPIQRHGVGAVSTRVVPGHVQRETEQGITPPLGCPARTRHT